jgi:hypothetical protein
VRARAGHHALRFPDYDSDARLEPRCARPGFKLSGVRVVLGPILPQAVPGDGPVSALGLLAGCAASRMGECER